ncbi:hypothetical protein N7499_005112 [Penicillium canescens]|nr:hypothetical protein N7499_005112 [Penicillium canescens]
MKAPNGRLYPRHHNTAGFLPIAPRPGPDPGGRAASVSTMSTTVPVVAKSKSKSASGSRSGSVSASGRPSRAGSSASLSAKGTVSHYYDAAGAGDWSGSETSGSGSVSGAEVSFQQRGSFPEAGLTVSSETALAGFGSHVPLSNSAPSSLADYPAVSEALFDSAYSLLPSSSAVSDAQLGQALPSVSPLEGANPFEFPLDPALALGDIGLGSLDDVDMSMDVELPPVEEGFHVEDWSRYMWSPETGFEHLDMGITPVLR